METEQLLEEWTNKLVLAITPPTPPFTLPLAWKELAHASIYKVLSDVFEVGVQAGLDGNVTQAQLVSKALDKVQLLGQEFDEDGYHGC